jgi:sulfite exporter TauE/SafE
MELVIAAISLGFLGSFHCIGMCGPIAMALPTGGKQGFAKIIAPFVYNAGRVVTYSLFGLLFGLLGKGFIIGGYQQLLSVLAGILILAGLLLPYLFPTGWSLTKIISTPVSKVKSLLSEQIRQRTLSSFLFIGILNGFLPCGLVYIAVAAAIATGTPVKGAAFMTLFGLGTLPAMLFASGLAHIITANTRTLIRKSVPVFAAIMACILILRGLNLGIPYISPELSKTDCTKHSCCHKKN